MLRTLLHFFLIGGLLFGAKVFIEGRRVEGPEITVRVSADATQERSTTQSARRFCSTKRGATDGTNAIRSCLHTSCATCASSTRIQSTAT